MAVKKWCFTVVFLVTTNINFRILRHFLKMGWKALFQMVN